MHLAAVVTAPGRLEIAPRPTPKPGPGEILVAVKSVALNPADGHMRNGLFIREYPTVIGFDLAGVVLEAGEDVPYPPGTRVAAYSAYCWKLDSDYGAFQERCLVPWQHAVPFDNLSWNAAATLPVSVQVPLSAWDVLHPESLGEKDCLLIWGASSSVGSMGVQTARTRYPSLTVYATAGQANHAYVTSLGAHRVFDYKDADVVNAIVSAAKKDGLSIRHCFLATGDLAPCRAVVEAFGTGEIASAPIVEAGGATFIRPSTDQNESLEQFRVWFAWLKDNLHKIRPSPEPTVVGGLDGISDGLDRIQGVSCTKLVIEVDK